jgi:hypothetical protein
MVEEEESRFEINKSFGTNASLRRRNAVAASLCQSMLPRFCSFVADEEHSVA